MKKRIKLLLVLLMPFVLLAQTTHRDSSEVSISIEGGLLQGTLFTPVAVKNPAVVLIIAGSGPTDRNGNSRILPGKNNSLLQLADSLAAHGIASLRYDKRGIGASQIKGMKEENMLFSDGVNDAIGWIKWLREKGYKKIYIAGHSEGSLVGMAAAAEEKPSGFISIAGSGRRIDKVLKEQINAGAGPDSIKQLASHYLDTLLAGQRINKPNPLLFSLFRPSIQPYMTSWLQYDPAVIIANLSLRVLIVQGKKDIQIQELDAQLLHEAHRGSRLVLIDSMNHVLKSVNTDNRAENMKAYSKPELPVVQELVDAMVKFIKRA
jgi:pimeloyl-ACP methyl ester carboxylesterase